MCSTPAYLFWCWCCDKSWRLRSNMGTAVQHPAIWRSRTSYQKLRAVTPPLYSRERLESYPFLLSISPLETPTPSPSVPLDFPFDPLPGMPRGCHGRGGRQPPRHRARHVEAAFSPGRLGYRGGLHGSGEELRRNRYLRRIRIRIAKQKRLRPVVGITCPPPARVSVELGSTSASIRSTE